MLLLFASACSEEKPHPQQQVPTAVPEMVHAPVPQVLKVVVPDDVAGKWSSVRVAVRDQQTGAEDIFSVDIGGSFVLSEEQLRITVEAFLPAFVMDGKQITSTSNQTTNPAVRIVIHQAEKELYRGWLFGLYPDTHTYQHPRYNFTLLDFTPAG